MERSNLQNQSGIEGIGYELHKVAGPTEFPVDVFPQDIKHLVNQLNKKQNYPIDFIGSSFLFAASVAGGNGFQVSKPFHQTPVIYLALVAKSGQMKSHPLNFAIQPLKEFDQENFEQYRQEKQEYEADQTGEMLEPVWKQHMVIDATPEALFQIHDRNKLGLGLHKDELASFVETFDRYSNGSDLSFWLSNWSLQTMSKNRVKTEDYHIQRPFISIAGTIQTPLLDKLASNNRIEVGLLDRFLFAVPSGLRAAVWPTNTDTSEEQIKWTSIIREIATSGRDRFDHRSCELSFQEEAFTTLRSWQKRNAQEIDNANDSGNFFKAQMLVKLEIYAIRFSLLLAILYDPHVTEINKRHVNGALELVNYFQTCGLQVREQICGNQQLDPKNVIHFLSGLNNSCSDIARMMKVNKSYVSKVLKGEK